MGEIINLTASDGHTFAAYEAKAAGEAKGRIVVVQEIFGVNSHIRNVCDGYAADGYHAVAPALFDRVERDVELGYDDAALEEAFKLMGAANLDNALLDVKATTDHLGGPGEVGIVGYCWGGLITWLAACRLDMGAASSYYGGSIGQYASENPTCPTICHFGEKDAYIPLDDDVEKVRSQHPEVEVHVYPADHGFNCDERASYEAASAAQARERSLALFGASLK